MAVLGKLSMDLCLSGGRAVAGSAAIGLPDAAVNRAAASPGAPKALEPAGAAEARDRAGTGYVITRTGVPSMKPRILSTMSGK